MDKFRYFGKGLLCKQYFIIYVNFIPNTTKRKFSQYAFCYIRLNPNITKSLLKNFSREFLFRVSKNLWVFCLQNAPETYTPILGMMHSGRCCNSRVFAAQRTYSHVFHTVWIKKTASLLDRMYVRKIISQSNFMTKSQNLKVFNWVTIILKVRHITWVCHDVSELRFNITAIL